MIKRTLRLSADLMQRPSRASETSAGRTLRSARIIVLALVPVAGAVVGALVAVATTWLFIDDPFATALVGFGLLLALVPTGAMIAALSFGARRRSDVARFSHGPAFGNVP